MASPVFGPGPGDSRALNRAITWSVAIHVLLVVTAMVVPRDWFGRPHEKPRVMTISLGGTEGPKTSGTTPVGGRTVEKVVPPEKRPEPIRPAPPKQEVATVAVRTPPKAQPSTEVATIKPTAPPKRAPTTGAQIVTGSTAVETGARGQGVGLMQGGGGMGGEADMLAFCCPEYVRHLLSTIDGNWAKNQPEQGLAILKFTIRRDGSIHDIVVEKSSGSGPLDRIAKAALQDSRLLRLPPEYKRETLTIHLTFPYGSQ